MARMDLTKLTIVQTHQGLLKKQFSAIELAKAHFEKIKKENQKIFAFLTITENLAYSQAKAIDDQILQKRKISLLAGIPVAIKDNILVEGVRCTAGSKILSNYIASYDATVIKKLKQEGAVILGKTNLDEFAIGSSGEYSAFNKTRNPHDLTKVPGGSSSGSASAVSANLAMYALGSDTGGSVRLPASFCGVVGLKPTYGAVSRYGLIAMASSLDQIGLITKTVEDARIVFGAISGRDPMDSTTVSTKPFYRSKVIRPQELKIGIPKEYFIQGIDKEIKKIIDRVIEKYQRAGTKIQEISLPHTQYALATYYIIMPAELSANLARYDGIKYGFSKIKNQRSKIKNLLDVYLKTRAEGFGPEVRRRIILGTYVLSAGFYEAYYLRAQKVRTLIKKDFERAFQKVDVILTPTSPTPAFEFGEKLKDPLTMYLSDIFMIAVNLAGLPAVSIPCGKIGKLPVGFQLIGKPFEEEKILGIGRIYEKIG